MTDLSNNNSIDAFCEQNKVDRRKAEASGIQWSTLSAICEHHHSRLRELQTAGMVVTEALQPISSVHSLKMRVKDPAHLIEKIIRKRIEDPETKIDETNYAEQITDLVGVRVLHLFKEDWMSIHEIIDKRWEFHETPNAYVRTGDSESYQEAFRSAGFEVQDHPYGYRSLHYLAKCQPHKTPVVVELQVRTIFEEGWSEIDHRVRYPSFSDNPLLNQFLKMFNRLAGSADEMGSFVVMLNTQLLLNASETKKLEVQLAQKGKQIEEMIEKLNISENEKTTLKQQLSELRSTRAKESRSTFGFDSPFLGQTFMLDQQADLQRMLKSLDASQMFLDQMQCSSCGAVTTGLISGKCIQCTTRGLM